ncbi:MAG: serine/threonine protein kinase [Myxococcales bacterium]|nr:serine/threonine protein kinase [Myxococcales bacterium]
MRHVCPECGETGDRGACPRDGAMRAPIGADGLLGERIGSWRVASLLGAGGMGRVYKAVQPEIGARVAIKVLKREAAADPDLVERFFNEARAVNVIRHDSIVDVIDLGRLPDGAPYIVMEFLEGASLNALLRRPGRLPLGTFARWMAEALDALATAHAKDIVHRDLKPDNVFISPTGRVTVLDFGIAKLGGLAGLVGGTTQTGSLLGTPAYMAPEQARSQPVDPRADLYAMGVILFEGATGQQPFSAASLYELLDLHVKTAPPSPRSLEPTLPEAFEAVILRALAKDPAERFASALAMKTALLAAVEHLPSEAFAQVSIASPARPGPSSDPYGATAATHSSQASLAHGETMPSSPPPPAPAVARGIELRRSTVVALGGAALLGLGAVVFVVARSGSSTSAAPPGPELPSQVAVVVDAGAVISLTPRPLVAEAEAGIPAPDATVKVAIAEPGEPDAGVKRAVADAGAVRAVRDAVVTEPADAEPVSSTPPDAAAPRIPPPALPEATTTALYETGRVSIKLGDLRRFDVFKGNRELPGKLEKLTGKKLIPMNANWDGIDRDGTIDATAGGYANYFFVTTGPGREDERCIVELRSRTAARSSPSDPDRAIRAECPPRPAPLARSGTRRSRPACRRHSRGSTSTGSVGRGGSRSSAASGATGRIRSATTAAPRTEGVDRPTGAACACPRAAPDPRAR